MRVLSEEQVDLVSGGRSSAEWEQYFEGFSDRNGAENIIGFFYLIGLFPAPYF